MGDKQELIIALCRPLGGVAGPDIAGDAVRGLIDRCERRRCRARFFDCGKGVLHAEDERAEPPIARANRRNRVTLVPV